MSSKLLAAQQTMAGVVARRSKKDYSECFQVRRGWACARVCAAYTMSVQIPVLGTDVPPAMQPPELLLPLYEYQRRSLTRLLAIERNGDLPELGQICGGLRSKGGVVCDTVGLGKV